jgi:hypothetical protein
MRGGCRWVRSRVGWVADLGHDCAETKGSDGVCELAWNESPREKGCAEGRSVCPD